MRRNVFTGIHAILLLWLQAAEPQPEEACLACGAENHAGVMAVREKLAEAFRLSMTIPDCDGTENYQTCRSIEGLLDETFETLDEIVAEGENSGSIDCIACDPKPHLSPLFASFETLSGVLVERGYAEFVGKQRRMQQEVELWKGYRCCGALGTRAPPARNREMEARSVLGEKCGVNFEKNRQGLRQVVRMPGDREGCFQSRACPEATQHNGQFNEAADWTYDGEYWYIWAERRTPRGEWIDCDP